MKTLGMERRIGNYVRHALLTLTLLSPVFSQTRPAVNAMITASAFGAFAGVAAPGSYVEIYVSNLAGTTRGWAASDFSGSAAPITLDGVTVTVNGTRAYVNYISPTQVNIQIPDTIAVGPAAVVAGYQGLASAPAILTINALEPGLLAPATFRIGGTQYVAAVHAATGAYVSNGNIPGVIAAPAAPGETLTFYGTGFGPITQGPFAGQIASGQTTLANPFTMTIGGSPATIRYAGLAPGLVGVYQFNVVVPLNLPTADLPVQIALNGVPINLQNLFLPVNGAGTPGAFTLTSLAGVNGGSLPADYTCDGTGSTIPLSWSNPPAGTQEFALLLSTAPTPGTIKYDWVLYHIPPATTSLAKDSFMVGTVGLGDDGPGPIYDPPCSQGPGAKLYTFTLYALSAAPAFFVPASQVTGQTVADAISSITLGSAALNLSYSRVQATATGSSTNCLYIRNSTTVAKSGAASVNCDSTYAYVGSIDSTTDQTMNGITSTNLQVPTPQNFLGANGWKIPLNPAIAPAPTPVVDGPIGVAINGIPIFNPCTQGGTNCSTGGDTKSLGQLDTCNGHSGRADDYHYHAAPNCLMAEQPASYWNTHPLGWALDGFAIFGYNDANGATAQRDNICGGNTNPVQNAPAGYSYHVTDAYPYVVNNCLTGVPSPGLPNQGSKYHPMRQPPVTPFDDSAMTLTTDPTDGYQVLQFTSALPFTTTETGSDSYTNSPGTYKIRYKQVTGSALAALLALQQNAGATVCWNFQFLNSSGATTQPTVSYCK
jgi:uncharacterized protein (TIGR03437 family)